MDQSFARFLRNGLHGEVKVTDARRVPPSRPIRLTLRRLFPDYEAHRAAFEDRLDQAITDNTAMLLAALNPPDEPPIITEADLPDPIEARTAALNAWDENIARIWTEWKNLPPRFKPQREAMEEPLLRRFSSIVNQTRQTELGIEQYIWQTAGDKKVRSHHAARDGETFDWEVDDIHPGTEPNCRCTAVPVLPGQSPKVIFAQTPTMGVDAPRPLNPIGALLGVIAELLVVGLTPQNRAGAEAQIAETYGLDLNTSNGALAAELYLSALQANRGGLLEDPEEARIAAEAMLLYTLAYGENLASAVPTPNDFLAGAIEAYRQGNLTLQDDTFAQGWVEVFPELTEDERRLAELPGFTAEQQEAFREGFSPADPDLFPHSTGGEPVTLPDDGIISTPVPEEQGPQILESRDGDFETPDGNVIRNHGNRGDGEDYMRLKGHEPEQIDAIIDNPNPELSGYVAGRQGFRGQEMRLLVGDDGHWVILAPDDGIVAMSNRNRPLRDSENDLETIVRPLE